jgi:hypothetical protein
MPRDEFANPTRKSRISNPSSDAAAPATTPVRTDSARSDARTSKASSPFPRPTASPEPNGSDPHREPRTSLQKPYGYKLLSDRAGGVGAKTRIATPFLVCAGPRFPATVRAGLTDAARAGEARRRSERRRVATMATLTVRSGSDGFGRIGENPCKTAVSANCGHRARTCAHIAPRRSPVRVRLAPSKTLEISAIPEGAGGASGTRAR